MAITRYNPTHRPAEVWGQIDTNRFGIALLLRPDDRGFGVKTRRFVNRNGRYAFVDFWAFRLCLVRFGAEAA